MLVSIYWVAVGNKNFFKSIGFLLIYPLFLFFWRIPKLIFKNWIALFATFGFLTSFFRSLKRNFVTFSLVSLAAVVVLFAHNEYALIASVVLLVCYLVVHFAKRFYTSFTPSKALAFPKDGLITLLDGARTQYALPQELKSTSIEKYTPEQQNRWAQSLQMLLILNRASTFVAAKLKQFQESRIAILYFLVGLLFSLFLAVLIFALANLAVHKIDPTQFSERSARGILFFIYYSFNTLVTNGIADFYPVLGVARLLNTAEVFFGILTLVILVTVYTSVKSEKTRSEIDTIISTLDQQGDELEQFINKEFSMNVEEAITEVQKLPGNFIKIIYYFTAKKK